jgi:hypothetical protein
MRYIIPDSNLKLLGAVALSIFLPTVSTFAASVDLCPAPAWATENSIQHKIIGDVTCKDLDRVYSVVDDLNKSYISKAGLRVPQDFLLTLLHHDEAENFDGYRLEIALHHIRYDSNFKIISKSEKETLPVIIHEYGHVALSSNLSHDSTEFRSLNQIDRMRSFLNYEYSMLQKVELKDKYNVAAAEYARNMNAFNSVAPYHELFADLFAVNYFGEVESIENAIRFPMDEQNGKVRPGNFSVATDPETWRETESHVLFNPVRYFVWNNFLSPASHCKATKQEKLAVIYNVIGSQIDKVLNEIQVKSDAINVPRVNRELIEIFSNKFNKSCVK